MKGFVYVLLVIAIGLTIYNATQINYEDPLGKNSYEAVITTVAGGCAILVLCILLTTKRIDRIVKKRR